MNTKLKQRTDKGASVSKRNIRPGVRILHIIKNTFILLLVIAAVSMMVFTIVSVTTFVLHYFFPRLIVRKDYFP